MKVHILGICGTFMAGIAVLAKQSGIEVEGCDQNVYPPMSTQLEEQGIQLKQGFLAEHLQPSPDCVVVGNVMKRGHEAIEYMLNEQLRYTSGPQWLSENVLQGRWVLAVAGTHGKTTTSSMLAWILEYAGLKPGFLIGGIPQNFGVSARLGESKYFVMEADEYDSAFFDKRSKFIHYHPRTVILNNLEFDHADIFDDLEAIKKQFHHLVRTIPGNGLIVHPAQDDNIRDVLQKGCWTPTESFGDGGNWQATEKAADGSSFDVTHESDALAHLDWGLIGEHNVNNALAAIAAARHAGVSVEQSVAALNQFKGIKRRMELRGEVNGARVYDDFAHHPTAIISTIAGLRNKVGQEKIIGVLDLASYTMRTGVHKSTICDAMQGCDSFVYYKPKDAQWDVDAAFAGSDKPAVGFDDVDQVVAEVKKQVEPDAHVLVMSNSGFGGFFDKLLGLK